MALINLVDDTAEVRRLVSNAKFDYNLHFFPDITATVNIGYDKSNSHGRTITSPFIPTSDTSWNGSRTRYTQEATNKLFDAYLTYKKSFNENHNLNVVVGHSYQSFEFNNYSFDSEKQKHGNTFEFIDKSKNVLLSYFGRLNYDFKGKYLLTATVRAEAASKLNPNDRWGYFPSVAVGWNISKEDVLADSNVVNNLKLRASWGQTGNQEGIDNKVSLASYVDSKGGNDTYPLDPDADSIDDYPFGTVPARTANPDLKWEVSTQTNIGLDFGLFGNKITGTLDYFNKVTSDVVLFANRIDPIQPTPKIWTNIPDMEIKNSGIEIALDYRTMIGQDLMLNLGGNLSYTKNEVTNSPFQVLTTGAAQGAGQTGATINGYLNNEPAGTFYMKEFIGIGPDGLNQFRDVNGDGEILDNDRIAVGSALPDIIYAFYFKFNYKDFDLGLNFNGVSGNKIYNHTAMSLFSRGQLSRNLNTTDFAVQFNNEDNSNSNEVSTRYLEDGSFLRLNNATLGYNLSPQKVGFGDLVSNVRFTLTGQNLFVITDYSGFDPEINTGSTIDGIQTFGIDRFTYPTPRTVLLGLNVSF